MTKRSDIGPLIKNVPVGHEIMDEKDYFYICSECGQPVDMCDLRQAMYHEEPEHDPLQPDA